jgi:hypothetical protein
MNKERLLNVLGRLPDKLLRWLLPPRFILYGHLISDRLDCMAAQRYRYPTFTEFNHFRSKVEKLGYRFVTLEQYFSSDWPRMILLTFDDGFVEVAEFHRRTALPFALFFVADALDDSAFRLGVFRPQAGAFLSRADIVNLKQAGIHIGFHTRSHKRIATLADIAGEILPPAHHMDLMSSPSCFAFPFEGPAEYASVSAALFAAGYEFVFDTKSRVGADGRHVFRIPMDRQRMDRADNPLLANVLQARLSALKRMWLGMH